MKITDLGNWVACPDCEDFKKQLAKKDKEIAKLREKSEELWQIYSHLGVEAFGKDIHEQALKEIDQKVYRIDVLEKALRNSCKELISILDELNGFPTSFVEEEEIDEKCEEYKKEAEKELEGNK